MTGGVGSVHGRHLATTGTTGAHCDHRGVDSSPHPAMPQHDLLLRLLDLADLLLLGAGHHGLHRAGALGEDQPSRVQAQPSQSPPSDVDDLISHRQHAGPLGPASLVDLHHPVAVTLDTGQPDLRQAHPDGLAGDPDEVDQPEVSSVGGPATSSSSSTSSSSIKLEAVLVVVTDVFLQYFPPVQRGGSGEFPGDSLPTAGLRGLTEVVRASSQDTGVLVIRTTGIITTVSSPDLT